jgi:hypothetical protein
LLSVLIVVATVLPSHASTLESTRHALGERYALSRIDIQNPRIEGYIASRGVVLLLQADGVAAKKLRVIQANTKSPRFHVRDYAAVHIAPDGRLAGTPGDFMLPKGTRLVVLDLKVEKDRVRLFTHTLARIPLADGPAGYGCTEFVFLADPELLARGGIGALQKQIERVLSRTDSA